MRLLISTSLQKAWKKGQPVKCVNVKDTWIEAAQIVVFKKTKED